MKVLMVITSHDQLGNTGRKTGFWLEELAAPYYVFKDAGVEITLASPKAADRRSILRATNPNPVPTSLSGSRRTRLRKRSSIRPFASTASSRKTSTPSSIRAAMARCGISPKTRIQSS
jgi:putative intracellular protease/amidase